MQAKMETRIISDMAKKGLVPSETPPQKIIITKKAQNRVLSSLKKT